MVNPMPHFDDIESFLLGGEFARLVAEHGVPGAAIAVLHDGVIVDAAAGVLSTATRVEATPDSVFQIGSITKVWTTTLVMQLVDEGLLDLDLPIRHYLPEFRLADTVAAARVTARHLLSHRGGFEGDVFVDTGRGDDAVEKYLDIVATVPQVFPPGQMFAYNNVGFSVLGRLVEVLRNTTWETAVMERIAMPLGLTHVAPSAYEAILYRAAVGHLGAGDDGVEVPTPTWALARSNEPAGSMLAMRPRDLLGFVQMHLDGGLTPDGTRLLSAQSAAAMRSPQVLLPRLTGMGEAWGLGWEIYVDGDASIIGHDGGTLGQTAFLRVVPGTGLAVAMLTNGGDVRGLFDDVVARILFETAGIVLAGYPTPAVDTLADPVDVTPILGRYSDTIYDIEVSVNDDGTIWLDRAPKGILLELGEVAVRTQLLPFAPGSLITSEATRGLHTVYAFLGDAGDGTHQYLHYGRVISRST